MQHCRVVVLLGALMWVLVSSPATADVVINEIMYNSSFTPEIEFVELYNTGPAEVNLNGWFLLDGNLTHPPCLLAGLLGVGDYLVVAADNTFFSAQYPAVTNVNVNDFDPDGLGFGLGNSGDTVNLFADEDELHDEVTYQVDSPWPDSPNGQGPSLELVNTLLNNDLGTSWDPSLTGGGTPGGVNSVFSADAAPHCRDGSRDIRLPVATDVISVTVVAFDEEGLDKVELWVDLGGGYQVQTMYDDGLHGDGAPADSIFGSFIPSQADDTLVRYYARATDSVGQTDVWPGEAPVEYRAYTVGHERPLLVINEILADNVAGLTDEAGEFEDWIELFNPGPETLDLSGLFLSDNDSDRHMWEIPPGQSLASGEFLVVWADAEPTEGPLHAGFKLSSGGEEVLIYDKEDLGNAKIHGFKYGPVAADVSLGFWPDLGSVKAANFAFGYSPEYLATPTPGAGNGTSGLYSQVCINEFHTTSLSGGVDDWVELFNRGPVEVDLSGMYLSDNRTENLKFMISAGTQLAPGEFLVINELELGFSFSSLGEVILLTAPDGVSGLDFYDYSDQVPDMSEGRLTDGGSRWGVMAQVTPGTANDAVTPVPDGTPEPMVAALAAVHAVPNPFNPRTEIRFTLGGAQDVVVGVYDVTGRRVCTLFRGALEMGSHRLTWDGCDTAGARLASGTYFARVMTNSATAVQKMLLLK